MKLLPALFSLVFSVLLLSGCQTVGEKKQSNQLKTTLKSYRQTVRWLSPAKAYNFLSPNMTVTTTMPDNIDNIRVVNYEILRPFFYTDEDNAYQIIAISFLFRDRQVEKTVVDKQHWQYNKKDKQWYRVNPIPLFK